MNSLWEPSRHQVLNSAERSTGTGESFSILKKIFNQPRQPQRYDSKERNTVKNFSQMVSNYSSLVESSTEPHVFLETAN